jgi:phosphoribosylformylglycinamidine cyclo-ligase
MHFVENKRVVENNMCPLPPLLRIIQEESGTEWKEMYKVFNMGHRMEVYVAPELADGIIEISRSFGIEAQVVGYVEDAAANELVIESGQGRFVY